MFGLKVTNGELFSGPMDNPSDKWLPAVQLSKSPFKPRHILLSLPPTYLDDAGGTLCQPPALASSYAFFTHKYPTLTGERVPFFGEPLFPCPWTYRPTDIKDMTLEKTGAWMNGVDTAEVLISWIGRTLLAKGEKTSVRIAPRRPYRAGAYAVYYSLLYTPLCRVPA